MAVNVWPVPCYFKESGIEQEKLFIQNTVHCGDRSSIVVKVLCYKLEGRWFNPSWCHWIFH